jgi:thiol-disulfide isomerase/thioredoxin
VIVGAAALAILLGGGLSGGASPGASGSPRASVAAAASATSASGAASASVAAAPSNASTPAPAASASASGAAAASGAASGGTASGGTASGGTAPSGVGAEPVITGAALPALPSSGADPARGMTAPTVQGVSFDGTPVAIQPSGRPTAIVFVAHWCPHCQREVPLIQAWINENGLPKDVDLVSVATGIDPSRPNYPPDAWLEHEGWTVPVLVDPSNTVAMAYGLTGYPFFVFLDGQGKVVTRISGELTIPQLVAALGGIQGS